MKRREGQKSDYERVLLAGVQATISLVSSEDKTEERVHTPIL